MTTVLPSPPKIAPAEPPHKEGTRLECAVIEGAGLFDWERVELLDGELISKMGKNRPHSDTAAILHVWLIPLFGGRFVIYGPGKKVAPLAAPDSFFPVGDAFPE